MLAGTFAGVALALKPANALFLGGPLVALALARRWAHLPLFVASLAPALLALTIWKSQGLGEVPLFAQSEATRLAAGLGDPVMVSATSWLDRTVRLDLDTWRENMSNLREFTWSARVLQFLPLAGAIAVARRSVPAAGLFLTWLLGYVVVKGAADVATVESGSFWRLIMPALPAFVLLAAAVPLLVPTFVDRMGPRLAPDPGRRPGLYPTVGVVGFLAVVPLAVLLLASQFRVQENPVGPGYVIPELVVDEIGVPVDPDVVSLTVRRVGDANVLRWTDSTTRARTFYRVYRSSPSRGFSDMVCEARGSDRCDLRAETLVTTRDHTFVDRDPPPDAIYRVGVAANWLDDDTRGDVFAISPPAAPPASWANLRRRRALERVEPRPEEGDLLGEQHVVVRQLRQHRRVVEQDGDHEHDRRGEQDRRRVARHAEPAGDRVEPAAPGREDEEHEPGHEPEQGVALLEAPPTDQLEHDQDQDHGADRRGDRDPYRRHGCAPSEGTAYRLPIATNSASVTLIA